MNTKFIFTLLGLVLMGTGAGAAEVTPSCAPTTPTTTPAPSCALPPAPNLKLSCTLSQSYTNAAGDRVVVDLTPTGLTPTAVPFHTGTGSFSGASFSFSTATPHGEMTVRGSGNALDGFEPASYEAVLTVTVDIKDKDLRIISTEPFMDLHKFDEAKEDRKEVMFTLEKKNLYVARCTIAP